MRKVRWVPQEAQKPRTPLADELKAAGSVVSHANDPVGHVPHATTGAPVERWQIRQ